MDSEHHMLSSVEDIEERVYTIRGQLVMLDGDLAEIYGYEVKAMNQQVRRNIERFPDDFMFQLEKEEVPHNYLKSQFVTLNENGNKRGMHIKKMPYAFTEQGIYMLATVLRGDLAVQQSISIMRAFKEMRHFVEENALMFAKINTIELKQLQYQREVDEKFGKIFAYMIEKEEKQRIFYDGQIFDAFSLLTEIVGHAHKEIVLIDGYIDIITLNILAKKKTGVDVYIYTLPKKGISDQDVLIFNAQYPTLTVRTTKAFHDRFLIIDGIEGYHVGASLKDAGKKCFGINKIQGKSDIKSIIQKAQQTNT